MVLSCPINKIKQKLITAGFIKNDESYPKFIWLPGTHHQILNQYNAVLRGFMNYYSFAQNKNRLISILILYLKGSCVKLLSRKYSLGSQAKVYKKFGPNLTIRTSNNKIYSFIRPSYKINIWDFKTNLSTYIPTLYSQDLVSIARLDNLVCSLCGSGHKVEMHHVRYMKNLNLSKIDKLMVKANRKKIPLCRDCHMAKHYPQLT